MSVHWPNCSGVGRGPDALMPSKRWSGTGLRSGLPGVAICTWVYVGTGSYRNINVEFPKAADALAIGAPSLSLR